MASEHDPSEAARVPAADPAARRGPSARLIVVLVPALFALAIALSAAVWLLARGDTARRAAALDAGLGAAAPAAATASRSAVAPGFVTIDSTPPATIFVDDRKVGRTPLIRYPLPPGRHRVRAMTTTGRSDTFTVDIEAGQDAPARALSW